MEQTKNVKKKIVQKTINESLNQSNLTTEEVEKFKSSGKIITSFVLRWRKKVLQGSLKSYQEEERKPFSILFQEA